jgi:hypothetical protein
VKTGLSNDRGECQAQVSVEVECPILFTLDLTLILNLCFPAAVPPFINSRSHDHTGCGQRSANAKVDDIVMPEIDGREDNPGNGRNEEIEEPPLIAVGQV